LIPEDIQEKIEKVSNTIRKNQIEQRVLIPVLDEDIPLGVIIIADIVNVNYYRSHFNLDAQISLMNQHMGSMCRLEFM